MMLRAWRPRRSTIHHAEGGDAQNESRQCRTQEQGELFDKTRLVPPISLDLFRKQLSKKQTELNLRVHRGIYSKEVKSTSSPGIGGARIEEDS